MNLEFKHGGFETVLLIGGVANGQVASVTAGVNRIEIPCPTGRGLGAQRYTRRVGVTHGLGTQVYGHEDMSDLEVVERLATRRARKEG